VILGFPELAILVTNSAIKQKDVAIGIIMAESGGRTDARNHVVNPSSPADGSWDRGIWQWNSYWHKEISDVDADDPQRATEYAAWISKGGTSWSAWTTFNHGSHLKHIPAAQAALAAIGE
jgi:hypothetical protein